MPTALEQILIYSVYIVHKHFINSTVYSIIVTFLYSRDKALQVLKTGENRGEIAIRFCLETN